MSRRDFIGGGGGYELVDANGSFRRFLQNAPKEMRKEIQHAVTMTSSALRNRMSVAAPVGPDAPHLKEAVSFVVRGLVGKVGYIEGQGGDDPSGSTTATWKGMEMTNAWVALFNEYRPNKQPFMKPSAEKEAPDFIKRMTQAITQAERNLSGGGGLL